MKLLLDTHVWLWSLLEPHRLSARTRARLQDADAELWLSPISTWEAHLLAERGRLVLPAPPTEWVRLALAASPLIEAPLTHAIALQSRAVALPHADPADRFLVATAQVLGLRLLTADRVILGVAGLPVLPAS